MIQKTSIFSRYLRSFDKFNIRGEIIGESYAEVLVVTYRTTKPKLKYISTQTKKV